jgi:hypothetical protein
VPTIKIVGTGMACVELLWFFVFSGVEARYNVDSMIEKYLTV